MRTAISIMGLERTNWKKRTILRLMREDNKPERETMHLFSGLCMLYYPALRGIKTIIASLVF